MKHHNDEQYVRQVPLSELQNDYFQFYHYNFWMHKANAVLSFIEHPDRIKDLRFEEDEDLDEYILDNLKMELHMMVFHSSESLFLNIFLLLKEAGFVTIRRGPLINLINRLPEKEISSVAEYI